VEVKDVNKFSKWLLSASLAAAFVLVAQLLFLFLKVNSYESTKRSHLLQLSDHLKSRTSSYENILAGAKELFIDYEEVTAQHWSQYHAGLNSQELVGLSSLSYSPKVTATQRRSYESRFYRIYPQREAGEYYPVTFLAPSAGLERFFGFDTSSINPSQYKWVEEARDTGQIYRTDLYNLTASGNKGMFIAAAVYEKDQSIQAVEQRRRAFKGIITASFRADEIFKGLLHNYDTSSFEDIEVYGTSDFSGEPLIDLNKDSKIGGGADTFEVPFGSRPLAVKALYKSNQAISSYRRWIMLNLVAVVLLVAAWLISRRYGAK
jgi:CHASE1-domain containing sensor protein